MVAARGHIEWPTHRSGFELTLLTFDEFVLATNCAGFIFLGAVHEILVTPQLTNLMFGQVGLILNMTGHERDTTRGMAIAAGSNVALNLVLIPLFGMCGAAVATAITVVLWKTILWRSLQKRLAARSSAFFNAKDLNGNFVQR